jgi:hypothetical protein
VSFAIGSKRVLMRSLNQASFWDRMKFSSRQESGKQWLTVDFYFLYKVKQCLGKSFWVIRK